MTCKNCQCEVCKRAARTEVLEVITANREQWIACVAQYCPSRFMADDLVTGKLRLPWKWHGAGIWTCGDVCEKAVESLRPLKDEKDDA